MNLALPARSQDLEGSVGNAERDVHYTEPLKTYGRSTPFSSHACSKTVDFPWRSPSKNEVTRSEKKKDGLSTCFWLPGIHAFTCTNLDRPDSTLLCGVLTAASSTGERHAPPSSLLLSPLTLGYCARI